MKVVNLLLLLTVIIITAGTVQTAYILYFININHSLPKFIYIVFPILIASAILIYKLKSKTKKIILGIIFSIVFCEILLQISALAGFLPNANIFAHVPYGRVFWTKEGFSNGIMNSDGWYAKEFPKDHNKKKIIFIGDSMVEALQVHCDKNTAAIFNNIERNKNYFAYSLGVSETGPAYYYEILKYAKEKFNPQEAIIFLFMGNDFRNSNISLQKLPASSYIFYNIKNKKLELTKGSEIAQYRFSQMLKLNNKSFLSNGILTIKSHLMLRAILQTIREQVAISKEMKQLKSTSDKQKKLNTNYTGLSNDVYSGNFSNKFEEAIKTTFKLLEKCNNFCKSNNMKMKIILLPSFPPIFYEEPSIKAYDENTYPFIKIEKRVSSFCNKNNIKFLGGIKTIFENFSSPDKIKELMFSNGVGHFSEKGHHLFAENIYKTFYKETNK